MLVDFESYLRNPSLPVVIKVFSYISFKIMKDLLFTYINLINIEYTFLYNVQINFK